MHTGLGAVAAIIGGVLALRAAGQPPVPDVAAVVLGSILLGSWAIAYGSVLRSKELDAAGAVRLRMFLVVSWTLGFCGWIALLPDRPGLALLVAVGCAIWLIDAGPKLTGSFGIATVATALVSQGVAGKLRGASGWAYVLFYATAVLVATFYAWELRRWRDHERDARDEVRALERRIAESALKRYLSPQLVQELLRQGGGDLDRSTTQAVTVLFSDLAGFTRLCEKLEPAKVAARLDEYLSVMSEVAFAHGATIDKFRGDGMMLLFGAPRRSEPAEQVKNATACALAMIAALADLNRSWGARGDVMVDLRVGIHHGPALVGSFGSPVRSDYTAIGATVNKASLIEGAGEPGVVLLSAEVAALLPPGRTGRFGVVELKGLGRQELHHLVG